MYIYLSVKVTFVYVKYLYPWKLPVFIKVTCVFEPYYCIQTLTRHSWIHYTDCWIVK